MKTSILLLLLFFFDPSLVECQTCSSTKEAYVSLGFPEDHVTSVPIQGQFNQLCPQTTETCCTSLMESTFENTTKETMKPLIPPMDQFNDHVNTILLNAGDEYLAYLSSVKTFLGAAVPSGHAAISSAFQQVLSRLTSIVDDNVNATDLVDDVNRLLLLLRLNVVDGTDTTYTTSGLDCAVTAAAGGKGFLDSNDVAERLMTIASARFHMRELLTHIYLSFEDLEEVGLPVDECVRSYSQLFYCHICSPNTAGAVPCRDVCDNVLAGCAGHLHILGNALLAAQKASSEFIQYESSSNSWNFREAVLDLRKLMLDARGGTISELEDLVSKVGGCDGIPNLQVPSVDAPRPIVDQDLTSDVPVSFSDKFSSPFTTFKATVFDRFKDISSRFDSLCQSLSSSQSCWTKTELVLRTNTRKVEYGEDALYNNPDIIINGFDDDISSLREPFSNHITLLEMQTNVTMNFLNALSSTFTTGSSGWSCLPSVIVVAVCMFVVTLTGIL